MGATPVSPSPPLPRGGGEEVGATMPGVEPIRGPMSREYGTYKTVKARVLP